MNSSTGNSMMNSATASTKGKRVAKKTEDAPAPTGPSQPVTVAPVVAATPVATEAPAKRAVKKASATAVATPAPVSTVVAPTPVATTEAPAPATEAPATTLDQDLKSVLASLVSQRDAISAMITEVKRLDKRVHREIKDARKRKRRAPKEGEEAVKRGPSIFEIPTKVTDELCKFLGHPAGTLISRSNVTKQINNYVKEKGLKNKHDIKPDAALKKLLQVPEGEQLTYFNLQRYLNRHYIKETKA
jgi:chromatin remodeling complex protein RSC6